MIRVSSICYFVRFQYDLRYASSEKPWFAGHVPFQIHVTRKQWSVFRQSVVLLGFNMTWDTPQSLHSPRSLAFPVIQKAPQSGSYYQRRESASHFSENTNNDLPFVKKLQISCSFTNTILRIIWIVRIIILQNRKWFWIIYTN